MIIHQPIYQKTERDRRLGLSNSCSLILIKPENPEWIWNIGFPSTLWDIDVQESDLRYDEPEYRTVHSSPS